MFFMTAARVVMAVWLGEGGRGQKGEGGGGNQQSAHGNSPLKIGNAVTGSGP
jgi:hypothetical protein